MGLHLVVLPPLLQSRPVWGAWIEMRYPLARTPIKSRRAPYGARGLKFIGARESDFLGKVAPRMGRVD